MIEIVNAGIRYLGTSKVILQDINIKVDRRKVVIVGPNGCGKTTLLKSILGLVPVVSGSVRVYGHSVKDVRNMVGLGTNIPEIYDLARGSVGEVIRLWAGLKNGTPALAFEMLDRLGIETVVSKPMHQLSTGQVKLVCNILALAFDPDTIIMDEPFDNVDQGRRAILVDLMKNYQGNAILVTHEFHLLKYLGGWELYFMMNGRLWGEFSPDMIERLYISKGKIPTALFSTETEFGPISVTLDSGDVQLINASNISNALEEVILS